MNVTDRLKRITGEAQNPAGGKPSVDAKRAAVVSDLRRRIDAIMERRPQRAEPSPERVFPEGRARDIVEVIDGLLLENDRGACFVSDGVLLGKEQYGKTTVAEMTRFVMDHLALLARDQRLAGFDPADALFLDTETTGLSGGTGTTAFLIGLGWFEGSSMITRQIFLRDFSDEAAGLSLLREIVGEKGFLVTFNGKAFDVGLLSTRFVMNRIVDPFGDVPHLDLLFPSRRLLGHRLDNCRLGTLEEEILTFRRHGDVPGYEIPARYFEWLRRRDGELMRDVFEHNRLDLVSMAALAAHLSDLVDADRRDSREIEEDLLAAARLRLHRGDERGGQRMLEFIINDGSAGRTGTTVREAARELSLIHKRRGEWDEARGLWERMALQWPGDLFALEELAKWCEHRARDYGGAIELVERALDRDGMTQEERSALLHRRARLLRRCGRDQE
ncbi:MAG: hypothetical protein AVO39_06495 [delta proteobacterium MLS_D]|jgi:uncharacterized protein|nr:MAG: hypothetical protein AVO39_06495 [delta proteobacterium MLS_D]